MRRFGFVGIARQARDGGGAISLRQAQAGLRLIADAKHAAADTPLTMDWDVGPSTKQKRRASAGGGRAGDALAAARVLRVPRKRIGEDTWPMAWELCVDGDTLNAVMEAFAITQKLVKWAGGRGSGDAGGGV